MDPWVLEDGELHPDHGSFGATPVSAHLYNDESQYRRLVEALTTETDR